MDRSEDHFERSIRVGPGGTYFVVSFAVAQNRRAATWEVHWTSRGVSGGPVVFHAPVQMYDFWSTPGQGCEVTGGACWTDPGFIMGGELEPVVLAEGDAGVFRELERHWVEYDWTPLSARRMDALDGAEA